MSPFITFRDKDEHGNLNYYVLQRDFPHYVGVVSSHPINDAIVQAIIPGYNLWVVFDGILRGKYAPAFADLPAELGSIYTNMAIWFHVERILTNPKKFEKWKSIPQPTM